MNYQSDRDGTIQGVRKPEDGFKEDVDQSGKDWITEDGSSGLDLTSSPRYGDYELDDTDWISEIIGDSCLLTDLGLEEDFEGIESEPESFDENRLKQSQGEADYSSSQEATRDIGTITGEYHS